MQTCELFRMCLKNILISISWFPEMHFVSTLKSLAAHWLLMLFWPILWRPVFSALNGIFLASYNILLPQRDFTSFGAKGLLQSKRIFKF